MLAWPNAPGFRRTSGTVTRVHPQENRLLDNPASSLEPLLILSSLASLREPSSSLPVSMERDSTAGLRAELQLACRSHFAEVIDSVPDLLHIAGFLFVINVTVHKAHPVVAPKLLFVAVEKVPVEGVERTGSFTGVFGLVVFAVSTVVAHPVNVICRGDVRLRREHAMTVLAHLDYVRRGHPVVRVDVRGVNQSLSSLGSTPQRVAKFANTINR